MTRTVLLEDTIAAIATALGEASVGIVRVSGPKAKDVANKVFRSSQNTSSAFAGRTRNFSHGYVVHPLTGGLVDECIALWMPGPRSYTAEDVLELQVHGGIRVVEDALAAVLSAGCRMAEPGEFTKRAFLNGRIDLSQAEGVIDLIRSKTERATRAALAQVEGQLGREIRELRKRLLHLQALVEVTIDYPEHDVEKTACDEVVKVGTDLADAVLRLAQSARMGQILREGVSTVIAGRPNVGKSSLMNQLLRRDRAIVTDIPGTTRDTLEEYVNIGGIPFRLVDTAGIRETEDVVERIGVERSRASMQTAEVVLLVLDGSTALSEDDMALLSQTDKRSRLVVVNKADVGLALDLSSLQDAVAPSPLVHVSVQSVKGMQSLEETLVQLVMNGEVASAETAYMMNARQANLLNLAHADLENAVSSANSYVTLDVIAVLLQSAYALLGEVIGEEVGEDLLDEIFSQFCLGK